MRTTMVRFKQQGNRYVVSAASARSSSATCTACNAPLLWIVMASGARMPLDLTTSEHLDNGELLCASHFASCPRAARFRDRKRQRNGPCPGDACNGTVRHGELMCATCWKLVPKRMRDDVIRTWKACRSGGKRETFREYEAASAAAIAAAKATKANRSVRQLDAFEDLGTDPG